jgi:predicted ArsR family transcriptional regulator
MKTLTSTDNARILLCLHDGPKTCKEVADALGLSYPRATQLLEALARKRVIHSPRCTLSAKGRTVNLWVLRQSEADHALLHP